MIVHFISKYLGIFLTILIIVLAVFVYADLKMQVVYLQSRIDDQNETINQLNALNTVYRQFTRYQLKHEYISSEELDHLLPRAEVLKIKNNISKEIQQ